MKKLVPFLALALSLFIVSGAGAKVIPSVTTTLTEEQVIPPESPTGYTTYVDNPNTALGAHADYTVEMTFGYGATGTLFDGFMSYEDPATYPQPSDSRESVKDIVVDSPAGLVGNPNAVPYEDRCDISTFETSVCSDSSVIGRYTIGIRLMAKGADEGGPTAPVVPGRNYASIDVYPLELGATPGDWEGYTKIALLKTDPEVPAKIGIFVQPPFGYQVIRQVLEISPDTEGQLQLRTRALNIDHKLYAGPDSDNPGALRGNFRIDYQQIRFFGRLPNGNAFMTSPTSCEQWNTTVWSRAHYFNDNADADPLRTGANQYKQGNTSSIAPDCSNVGNVPFPITGKVAIDTPSRDTAPAFDFTIENPGVQANDDNVSTSPRKVVTVVPASINVDVQQLGRVCPVADFNADTCVATSRVGSVNIQTPLLRAPLTGDVYLVKQNASSGLPDLGLRVRGAITFTQRGSNRYTGAKFNQIETTFDNIPQIGFSKLTFHLDGGANGLLRSLSCPTYNKAPAVPNFTYNFTGYTGATATSTTPLNMANCFGIQTLKKYPKCLHKKLPIRPNYQSRSRLESVVLYVDGRRKADTKKSPFRFNPSLKKLKLKKTKGNIHKFVLKATYDDKTISKKTATFKVCR